MSPKQKNWVADFWAWLKGPGGVICAIFAAIFIAGKIYGSDTSDMRNALALHTMQLQASTAQEQVLNNSIIELTKVTADVNKRQDAIGSRQDAQQIAMIELIRAMIPILRSSERRQHLQDVLDGMRKVGKNKPGDFAGGVNAELEERQ